MPALYGADCHFWVCRHGCGISGETRGQIKLHDIAPFPRRLRDRCCHFNLCRLGDRNGHLDLAGRLVVAGDIAKKALKPPAVIIIDSFGNQTVLIAPHVIKRGAMHNGETCLFIGHGF